MNYQARGIIDQAIEGPASYQSAIKAAEALLKDKPTWNGVTAEAVDDPPQEDARLSRADEDGERSRHHQCAPGQGSQAPGRLKIAPPARPVPRRSAGSWNISSSPPHSSAFSPAPAGPARLISPSTTA